MFTTAPVSVPVTRGTPVQPARGYHVSRFAPAESHGLISAAEFAAVTGPFQTAPEALSALRPADGSCLAPQSRLGLLTEALRAAGVELGHWDREVARWLAGLDVQTIAPVIGWVSRAGREPAPGLLARALADAIAYQTALTSWCPDCSKAAPEGCADHREDAARAAGYERALRCLATGREAPLCTPPRSADARRHLAPAVPRISS